MFRFIHTADIHLDSPLRGLTRYEGAPLALLRSATRRAFERLVQLAIDERVGFMIIAGDLYDGDWKDFNTGLFFVHQLSLLAKAGIAVVLLYGNHDAESALTRNLPLEKMANVHVLPAKKAGTVLLPELGVALHGRSFKERDTIDNLLPGYPPAVPGLVNIGVLHTALEGHAEHARYAPCTVAELTNKGYDYWALGHVHTAKIVARNPWIVFAGNLQGRHIRETGKKSAMLVTVDDRVITEVEPVYADVLRWAHVEVDAAGLTTRGEVESRVIEVLGQTVRELADGRPVAARLTIRGACAASGELYADEETFAADLRALALGLGADAVWIEKIRIQTTAVAEATGEQLPSGVVDDIAQLLGDAPGDPELLKALGDELRPLIERLPARTRQELDDPALAAAIDGRLDEVLRDATPLVLARLLGTK